MAIFRYCMTLQSRGFAHCVCWYDPDPIQGQGQGPFELPTIAHNCTFLGLSPSPLSRASQNWWLLVIVWDPAYSLSDPNFRLSFYESYHENSNFTECWYFTTFKRPYFRTAWSYSQMVEQVGSTAGTVHADMTLTRFKVKVTGLLNFQKLAKLCMHAGGDDRQPPSGAFWFKGWMLFLTPNQQCQSTEGEN